MKKQLILMALFSVSIVGTVNADFNLRKVEAKLQAGMCKIKKNNEFLYGVIVRILTKKVVKVIDRIPYIGHYINEPKALGTELAQKLFHLPGIGDVFEEIIETGIGLDAEDIGDLIAQEIQEQLKKHGVKNLDITETKFIEKTLQSILLPKCK